MKDRECEVEEVDESAVVRFAGGGVGPPVIMWIAGEIRTCGAKQNWISGRTGCGEPVTHTSNPNRVGIRARNAKRGLADPVEVVLVLSIVVFPVIISISFRL